MVNNIITISIDTKLSNQNSSNAYQVNGRGSGEGAAGNAEARDSRNFWQDKVTIGRVDARDETTQAHEQAYLAAGRNARRGYSRHALGGYGNYGALGATSVTSLQPGQPQTAALSDGRSSINALAGGQPLDNALPSAEFPALPMGADSGGEIGEKSKATGENGVRATDNSATGEQDENGVDSASNLTPEEKAEVEELKARDREVRSHEQAHISSGGGLVQGGATYDMTVGPDGKSYAVGGEVQIDTSKGSSPEASISKARQIRAAAMAPSEPSGQDMQVAAQASQMEAAARQEKAEGTGEKNNSGDGFGEDHTQTDANFEE